MNTNAAISKQSAVAEGKNANNVKLIQGGKAFFDLLITLIDQATHVIHLQTYIYDDDETGYMVAEALKRAAKRNVLVYLLADGYASQVMSATFIHSLLDAGIQFRFFEPLLKSKYFYFGRRLHHKVFVADAECALVGGINIANRCNDMPGRPAWLDFALYVEGNICPHLAAHCRKMWEDSPASISTNVIQKQSSSFNSSANHGININIRINDWVHKKNQISKSYIEMLRHTEEHITILCSYFLPGKALRKNIVYALKRGVAIRVITAGSSDILIAKDAERWLYDWLLRKGVRLYEYQKNILHGKLAVCDDRWMTIGSYNINDISAYASVELNLDVHNRQFAKDVRMRMDTIIAEDCIEITAGNRNCAPTIFTQLKRWSSYKLIRLIFHLFTFYFKRHSEQAPFAARIKTLNLINEHTQCLY